MQPNFPDTTQPEVDQDYDAIAALEPELFRQVIAEGGVNPERLTFIRKGRGFERHKGGARILPGDPADLCIQSWLQSKVDAALCTSAVARLNK